ncbi:MAG: peptide deformylase [Myxococcales bacterium]
MLLKIVQTGHPVLRMEGRNLTKKEIQSAEVQQLIELMRETMRDAPGVGLAAPQVGLSMKLTVIEDDPGALEDAPEDMKKAQERKGVPFHVLINPKIEAVDATPVTHFEGCLSLPGFSALVPRAKKVRVEALDHKGQPVTIEASGWYARILQHEIDHLYGRLYIDRMHTRSFTTNENAGRFLEELSVPELMEKLGIDER